MTDFTKKSPRYLLSRVLMRSGICRFLTFRTHGQQLRFYPTDLSAELWYNPDGRASDHRLLKAYLKPGDCYVDVGANIGSTVIAGAAEVGVSGRVLAVEPHPRIFRYMLGNIKLNGIRNVTARNMALAAEPGAASLSDFRSDDLNHIEPAGQGAFAVELATLDSLTDAFPSVALLKIDVEGYEAQVLAGARNTLRRTMAIYIEIADEFLRHYGSSANRVFDTLRTAGFHILRWANDTTLEEFSYHPHRFSLIEDVLAVRHVEDARSRLAPHITVR